MKKVFKLASAEFSKIFYRPFIFILTGLLIGALIVTNLLYKPKVTRFNLSYSAENVASVYNQFTQSDAPQSVITKASIDKNFYTLKLQIDNDYQSMQNSDKISELNNAIETLHSYLLNYFNQELLRIASLSGAFSPTQTIQIFSELKNKASNLLSYMTSTIKDKKLNFYLTQTEYDIIYQFTLKLHDSLPQNYANYTKANFIERGNYVKENFDFSKIFNITKNLIKIEINNKDYLALIDQHYSKAILFLNNLYENNIKKFYENNYASNTSEDIEKINLAISKYYSYANSNMAVLDNQFLLLRIGDKTHEQLKDLIGYTQISKYELTETISFNKYLLDNNVYDFNYLTSFNFNTASGFAPNAFDYTFYSMQILMIFILIFVIFYACSSIAGDQNSGMMKMIAIRPYSKNKLLTGKFISCILFGMLLLAISFATSFVVGIIGFGLPAANALFVFNGTIVLELSPYLLMLGYFISLFIELIFYTALAIFISLLFKSTALSVFISNAIYATGIILNGLVFSTWIKYLPFAHLELFKYFGKSQKGLLSLFVLPETNIIFSTIYLTACIATMVLISHYIFRRKNIA